MKKALLVALVAGLMAGTANAGILSMSFPGGATTIDAANGDIITVEVYFTPLAGGQLSTLATGFMSEPLVTQLSCAASQPGWAAGGVNDVFGANQFAVGSTTNFSPGALLGTMEVQFTGADGDVAELMFEAPGATQLVYNHLGAQYTYNPTWAAAYSGYYAFGSGSPEVAAVKTTPGQSAAPLIINGIPEPASLVLLALGGLALRRRS